MMGNGRQGVGDTQVSEESGGGKHERPVEPGGSGSSDLGPGRNFSAPWWTAPATAGRKAAAAVPVRVAGPGPALGAAWRGETLVTSRAEWAQRGVPQGRTRLTGGEARRPSCPAGLFQSVADH